MLFKLSRNLPNAPKVIKKDFKTLQKLQNASKVVESLPKAFKIV